jgi:hypothetical protein
MDQQLMPTTSSNGESTLHDLFALTDEQILEIEPEAQDSEASSAHLTATGGGPTVVVPSSLPVGSQAEQSRLEAGATQAQVGTEHGAQPGVPVLPEPPAWLAAQMKDPWNGQEAKELWNGVQQAKQEAAAYRAAFATPEDARALKELYPGGVNEARSAANRARLLDQIDGAYFGAAGSNAEQTSAARAQLAQMMLREDPAAFREMVFAGLRALEEAEKGSSASATTPNLPRLAQVFATSHTDAQPTVGATLGSPAADGGNARAGGASSAPTAFEKAANEDLERSVGASITRTIEQALPNVGRASQDASGRAGQAPPLHDRLSAAVRQDVEAALKGDRQLGEQIAQILSARRFDSETRAHVVRLIGDRARQLVSVAAKRVLNDWTQTTLAAHRGKAARADSASARREVAPYSSASRSASLSPGSSGGSNRAQSQDPNRGAPRPDGRRVDYRKLSDEQILDL